MSHYRNDQSLGEQLRMAKWERREKFITRACFVFASIGSALFLYAYLTGK